MRFSLFPSPVNRPRFLATVGALTAVVMLAFEAMKQWLHADMTLWESHALTAVVVTFAAVLMTHLVLNRQSALTDRLRILAQTTESLSETVTVTDMEDRLVLVNQGFTRIYGYAPDEVLGQSVVILRSDKNAEALTSQILPATRAGGWQGEIWNRRKDGTDFLLSLSTAVVRDEGGTPIALVGVGRDITDERAAEQAARDGLRWQSIATLAGGVAHNFNNLLQRIVGHANLAQEEIPPSHPARPDLDGIVAAAGTAARLTEQLLAYSRQGFFKRASVDLNREVRTGLERLRRQMPTTVAIDADLTSADVRIEADAPQLQQVLVSLVSNAVEAIEPDAGTVTLRTSRIEVEPEDLQAWRTLGEPLVPGSYAVIEVSDTGRGMDSATRERVFEPFFSTKFTGRGLGLPAVLGIVLRHRGGVQIDSQPGQGTTFRVAFPLSQPAST